MDARPPEFELAVSVSFPLDAAEWGRAMKAVELASPRARWLRPALWTLPVLVPVPFIVALVLGAGSLSEVVGAAVPWEILALMWPLMYEFAPRLFSGAFLRRMRRRGEDLVLEERGVSAQALWVRGNWDTTYLPWSMIASVRETPEFLLFRGPTDTYFLPKRMLGESELAQVRQLASARGAPPVLPPPARGGASGSLAILLLCVLLACCEHDQALVSASASLPAPLDLSMLTVQVRDGDRGWQWRGVDFQPSADDALPHTPERATQRRGTLDVSFRIAAPSGQTLSAGAIALPLRSDFRLNVWVTVSTADPTIYCFGCGGGASFGLDSAFRAPGRDSIWLVWGGNSIRHSVVY